jgi:hypothetical protein
VGRRNKRARRRYAHYAWRMTNGYCVYCGIELHNNKTPTETKATADHLIPIASEGREGMENVVPACGLCNQLKDAWSVHDFRLVCLNYWFGREAAFSGSIEFAYEEMINDQQRTAN